MSIRSFRFVFLFFCLDLWVCADPLPATTPGMNSITLQNRSFTITSPDGARLYGTVLYPRTISPLPNQ